jgi:hypothetical protein
MAEQAQITPPADHLYLGRSGGAPLFLPTVDLCTHAVCLGATGSGKTGLCLAILEEAALAGVPVLAIDPKGDVANLLLSFPLLRGEDLAPWVDHDEARRQALGVPEFAEREAARWRAGLEASGQGADRIARLRAAAEFTLYTPGSDAGVRLSLLGSLGAPPARVRGSIEALRERVQSTASALLALAGVEADALRSREHVLLGAILSEAWSRGEGLDLPALVRAVQSPPFSSIGVLDLESYYPSSSRFELVLALNSLLSTPAAAALFAGEGLDVERLLRTDEGKPRVSVLSLSHLGEAERRAFVTALLGQITGWMRLQSGSSSLRALLFMDEVAGYLPPLSSPPTKPLFLQLFKQARAFGLGVVVATQNPADVDYKALSNAGTWLVGRLQTARDRGKVMEGLSGAAEAAGGPFEAARVAGLLGSLEGRQFLMHTRVGAPRVLESRWTLSYLRGPLPPEAISRLAPGAGAAQGDSTRNQLTGLHASGVERPAEGREPGGVEPGGVEPARAGELPAGARPVLPPGTTELFVPAEPRAIEAARAAGRGLSYAPAALGAARIRYVDRRLGLDARSLVVLASPLVDGPLAADWGAALPLAVGPDQLAPSPAPGSRFQPAPPGATGAARLKRARQSLVEHLARDLPARVWLCDELGVASEPGEDEASFRARLADPLAAACGRRAAEQGERAAARLRAVEERVRKAEQALARKREQGVERKADALLTVGTSVLGALLGGKALSAQNAGRAARAVKGVRRAGAVSEEIARAEDDLEVARRALGDLHAELQASEAAAGSALSPGNISLRNVAIRAGRANVELLAFGVGWLPWEEHEGGLRPAWAGG